MSNVTKFRVLFLQGFVTRLFDKAVMLWLHRDFRQVQTVSGT